MPSPGEYKTVQSRILAYAQEIGWSFVPRDETERRRGFDTDGARDIALKGRGDLISNQSLP
jgi:type I restriction enzyme R subunit